MAARNRNKRHADDLTVARIINTNLDVLLKAADEVAAELGTSGCAAFVADARIAVELAERIDALIVLPEPLETLDRPVLFLVALGAIGIKRACDRKPSLRQPEKRAAFAARLAKRHVKVAAAPARLAAA